MRLHRLTAEESRRRQAKISPAEGRRAAAASLNSLYREEVGLPPLSVSSLYNIEPLSGGNIKVSLRNGRACTLNRDDAALIAKALLSVAAPVTADVSLEVRQTAASTLADHLRGYVQGGGSIGWGATPMEIVDLITPIVTADFTFPVAAAPVDPAGPAGPVEVEAPHQPTVDAVLAVLADAVSQVWQPGFAYLAQLLRRAESACDGSVGTGTPESAVSSGSGQLSGRSGDGA